MTTYSATYSPDDNKLRLYASSRLDPETYARVKAAGFRWAPKQELFFAPGWTPGREDLLLELAGSIDDDDSSLVERAQERAERFEDYSEKRGREADRARDAVAAIADNIPLGQPILLGHHSEKHARRDAEKIQNGMRKAVQLFKLSGYWNARAEGAIRHAKYKELPAVRARRIKGLEADLRKSQKNHTDSTNSRARWDKVDGHEIAVQLANFDHHSYKWPLADYPRDPPASQYEGDCGVWSALTDGICTWEQARARVLASIDRYLPYCERWIEHYSGRLAYERAMLAEAGGIETDRNAPQVGGGCRCWATARGRQTWSYIRKVNRISVTIEDNWGNGGRNFPRTIPFDKLTAVISRADVDAKRAAGLLVDLGDGTGFALLDTPPPEAPPAPKEPDTRAEEFTALELAAKSGVQTVVSPHLFPTPGPLAAQLVKRAYLVGGLTVLEPSAGTGNLVGAILDECPGACVTAVEIMPALCAELRRRFDVSVIEGDFLEESLWQFDRIVMNPPFANGVDIKHIERALALLKPGGVLVALCAAGPRQREKLAPLGRWTDLPAGSFSEQGTAVNVAMLEVQRPAETATHSDGKPRQTELAF